MEELHPVFLLSFLGRFDAHTGYSQSTTTKRKGDDACQILRRSSVGKSGESVKVVGIGLESCICSIAAERSEVEMVSFEGPAVVSNSELFDGTNSRIYLCCDCHLPLNERENLPGEGLQPLRCGASSEFDPKKRE